MRCGKHNVILTVTNRIECNTWRVYLEVNTYPVILGEV